ncbi:type II toxin-antitoxin system RelE/ParE family toxin [Paracoccus sp. SSK6]|uniref:type II toxin-antitoxin system RelE/ParE family toxin n=1 Tax=Paracoccus sp. SSK6 TaxID=3143131 RepID=UPI00321C19CC
MKIVFSDLSRARLHEIQAYIAYYNARAAIRVADRILYAAETLGDFPELGAGWKDGATRALVVSGLPYRLHYRIHGDTVEIITIPIQGSIRHN